MNRRVQYRNVWECVDEQESTVNRNFGECVDEQEGTV